jgi:NADPH-dependent curcumin reductase CurA
MKPSQRNRSVVLARRPQGDPVADDFRVEDTEWRDLRPGEFRTRNRYVSLDAGFRNWMNEGAGDAVLPAMALNAPVMGLVLAEVIESRHPDYPVGGMQMARFAWQEYSVSDGSDFLAPLPHPLEFEPSAYLGVLGDTGMSAYFGMLEIGKPAPGECVLVSAAGGAVGSIAGQLAKLQGATTVGIVGSERKADWIRKELGYDGAVVRSAAGSLTDAIRDACPNGVDLYFDNVGGEVLEAAIANMNVDGRLVLCGAISGYGREAALPGPRNLFDVVTKQLRIQGFMTHFRHARYPEARQALAELLREGRLKNPEYRLHGIDAVSQAFCDLFAGRNFGKTVVGLFD